MNNALIFGGIIFVIFILGFKIIRPVEKGIVERFGKYYRILEQGLRWVIPFVDRVIRVNITEIRLDVRRQQVITKDNLNLSIDGVVYFKVADPLKAIYNVNSYINSIPSLAQTTLRSIVGELEFTEVNAKRQTINSKIESELDSQTEGWGINILRVELQDVSPANDVQKAMDKVVTAEREKEAKITQSEAEKEAMRRYAESKVIEAEADKRSLIERARGRSEAIKIEAEAKALAIKTINLAAQESFKENAQKFKSLEVTENSLINNSKIVLTEKGISPTIVFNDSGVEKKIIPIDFKKRKKENNNSENQ